MSIRRTNRRINTTSRGFTLVEIMIAISLLAMMSTIIYVALRVTFRARSDAYRLQTVYHQAEVSMDRMRRSLAMAFLSKHIDEDRSRETKFIGKNTSVLFTYLGHMRMEPEAKESDQGAVEFYLANDKETNERALFMREKPLIDDDIEDGGKILKLAERVKSLRFEYYDAKEEEWEDEWKAEFDDVESPIADRKAAAMKKSVDKLSGAEELDEFVLPPAVRIQMVLFDENDNTYPFATAVQLPMVKAFSW